LLIASLATQLPEAGPKDEGHSNGEGESGGIVVGGAPVGDVELPEADAVLLQQATGVHCVKLEGCHAGVRLAALLNDLLHSPAGKAIFLGSFFHMLMISNSKINERFEFASSNTLWFLQAMHSRGLMSLTVFVHATSQRLLSEFQFCSVRTTSASAFFAGAALWLHCDLVW